MSDDKASLISESERDRLGALRERISAEHLASREHRPKTTSRGVHHIALISSDVETTVRFYQEVLGFPLTEVFENRDLAGSTHFFFDIGHGNSLAFFDLPGVGCGPYQEVLGGLHHLAISIERTRWEAAKDRLEAKGHDLHVVSDTSIYFADPDGARLELISDPLGEMYGSPVV